MGKAYNCGMCGRPILEAGHMEGYHGLMGTWEPLHEKCAGIIKEMAQQTGRKEPILRDGFAGAASSSSRTR
jgi:hypothetical protein